MPSEAKNTHKKNNIKKMVSHLCQTVNEVIPSKFFHLPLIHSPLSLAVSISNHPRSEKGQKDNICISTCTACFLNEPLYTHVLKKKHRVLLALKMHKRAFVIVDLCIGGSRTRLDWQRPPSAAPPVKILVSAYWDTVKSWTWN